MAMEQEAAALTAELQTPDTVEEELGLAKLVQGPEGPQGPAGPQGPPGADGRDGKDGKDAYDPATESVDGLMSAADKVKLDGVEAGAEKNIVHGVKGGAESGYRTGYIDLTPADIGAAAAEHTHDFPGGWTLLWENPRPTGSFAGRTLTVTGLNGYTSFLIVSKYGTGDVAADASHGDVCYVPSGTMLYTVGVVSGGDSGAMSCHFRQVTINPAANTVIFTTGQRIADGESLSTSGGYCIPLYILGT